MIQTVYNIFHIPYYLAYITRDGEVIRKAIVKKSKSKIKYFRVKKINGVFVLPKPDDIPPVKLKSGYIVVYDERNTFPMRLMSGDEKKEYDEELTQKGLTPRVFALTPLDIGELHTFLEAKVTEDILSDNEKQFPMWLLMLIGAVAIVAIVALTVYMFTKGQQPIIINGSIMQTPFPTPTPGYVVIP